MGIILGVWKSDRDSRESTHRAPTQHRPPSPDHVSILPRGRNCTIQVTKVQTLSRCHQFFHRWPLSVPASQPGSHTELSHVPSLFWSPEVAQSSCLVYDLVLTLPNEHWSPNLSPSVFFLVIRLGLQDLLQTYFGLFFSPALAEVF